MTQMTSASPAPCPALSFNLKDSAELCDACIEELKNTKAHDLISIDVSAHSSVADRMIVCSGTSNRHVCAIADRLADDLAKGGLHGIRISGEPQGEWVIVDAGAVIVHILQPEIRERYRLEDLYRCMASGEGLPNAAMAFAE